jgi:Flp pilus assembly protein TadG
MKQMTASFRRDRSGTTAVEFAIVAPIIFALMFWFFDIAFSLYARNSFMHAVNEAAREVYLDPDRTDEQLEESLAAKLGRFGEKVTVTSTLDTSGVLDYHVINAQMTYHFKSPPFSGRGVLLTAESRAPVIDYKLNAGEEVAQ